MWDGSIFRDTSKGGLRWADNVFSDNSEKIISPDATAAPESIAVHPERFYYRLMGGEGCG